MLKESMRITRKQVPKDYLYLWVLAVEQNWSMYHTSNGHMRWINPQGFSVFSPLTSSDKKSVMRVRAKLKRAGLVI